MSSEDDPGILRSRLDAHGADPSKVLVLTGVKVQQERRGFNLAEHLMALEQLLDHVPDMRLIVLDPVTAYLGKANANNNAEVRGVLEPLAELAARRKVTVVGINHHNKRQDLSYMYRGLGSLGIVAAARSAWGVVLDKDDSDVRILAPIKANYSVNPTGLRYRIIDGKVTFEPGPWTGKLDDQLQPKNNTRRLDECADWLVKRLAVGAVLSTTVFAEAEEQGFNKDLCYRAKNKLGIKASKAGFDKGWYWTLKDEGGTKDGC